MQEFGAEKILNAVSVCSPEDVAYAIIRGAALRQRSVYYPYFYASVVPAAYQFIPSLFEKHAATLYARD